MSHWEITGYDGKEVIFRAELPSEFVEGEVAEILRRLTSKHLSHHQILSASTEGGESLRVQEDPLRCGKNPRFEARYVPLSFHELVQLLWEARDSSDHRAQALVRVKADYNADLQAIREYGYTLVDILDAVEQDEARLGVVDYRRDMSHCGVCGCPLPVSTTATGALYYASCQACIDATFDVEEWWEATTPPFE